MSFYGGNQNGGQPGPGQQQQQMGRQPPNVQQVLTPQLFNLNVNPNQLHNFFNEHNSSQNLQQLNAAAANASSIFLQQQPQSFPVNLINEQLGVGVGQLLSSATSHVSQNQIQGLPISMNFPQALQVHAQTPPPQQSQSQNQQTKQKVFTGTVTKTHDNFGFIDEEVFFQMGVVKGIVMPKEGDRVYVEAEKGNSMPFKWNATRVQIVNIGGGLSSSLNNMSNIAATQAQHMGFNTGVGMQKVSAPSQPGLTSQPTRLHGAQPVTIVSNPHSVYSGSSNNRIRPNVASAVPPPVNPIPARDPPKRPAIGIPHSVPDPPPFINANSSVPQGIAQSERDRDLDRDRLRERERDRSRERARERSRERSRERERMRERDRSLERSRHRSRERIRDRSRERDKIQRNRSRERLPARDRSRDRSPARKTRGNSRDRGERSAGGRDRDDKTHSNNVRSRDISRDRGASTRPKDKEKPKTDTPSSSDKSSRDTDRSRDKDRKEKEPNNKNGKDPNNVKSSSPSSIPKGSNREDSKSDRGRERDKREAEKAKTSHSVSTDRSKRSRSKESIRTDKGHGTTERSRSRSTSPRRKSVLSPIRPRYSVELPKFSLNTKDINSKELQRRYPNLYIPSDFFLAKSTWMDTFPLHSPFEIGHSCPVQIMRKGVIRIEISDQEELENKFKDTPDILEPADASSIFKAKVMIPSLSSIETIYRKACGLNEDGTETPDNLQHIERLINFIVGMKTSKHEVMAIGGPWSPSLDGSNPQSDSQTLINTAIRCARALTGINLSGCKHWYRFMELYYKRSNCLETVVYFLPDVWSCLPGTKDWSKLKSLYKFALFGEKSDLTEKIKEASSIGNDIASANTEATPESDGADANPKQEGNIMEEQVSSKAAPANVDAAVTASTNDAGLDKNITGDTNDPNVSMVSSAGGGDDVANCSGLLVIDEVGSPSKEDTTGEDVVRIQPEDFPSMAMSTDNGVIPMEESGEEHTDADDSLVGCSQSQDDFVIVEGELCKDFNEVPTEDDTVGAVPVPTEIESVLPSVVKVLNPQKMNVAQLREELSRRNLSPKGLKAVLVSRLVQALKDATEETEQIKTKKEESMDTLGVENISGEVVESNAQSSKPEENGRVIDVQVAEDETIEISGTSNITQVNKDETKTEYDNCIRLVNQNLILEDHDDDVSIEDGEVKDDPEPANNSDAFDFVNKFPPDTFPIVKSGMKEEEIKMWERRYTLPKNTRLLLFPSETAKGGNFDCVSMTLGVLRDYRLIDKKEDNFEVSLFSEFFHEMLQRDFAFRIYREIVAEAWKDDSILTPEIKDEKTGTDQGEPATKRRKLSNNSVVPSNLQSKKIADPYLLLSFIFFDVTRCGYITESDLEDLFSCIGSGFTRAQVRKVVQKVVQKGNLYYRKLTDRADPSRSRFSSEDIQALGQGNYAFIPVFVLQDGMEKSNFVADNDNSDAVVAQVDGKSVDVKKLMAQVELFERNLAVAESSLNVMKNSLNESKSHITELKKSNESLKDELSKTKDALKKSESSEKSAKESVDVFRRATERYCERVKDFVKFPSSPSSGGVANKEKTETTSSSKETTNTTNASSDN